ncbi:tripartite tricarboxylate transporter TctB family protein [Roseinatronobacter sp. NSM]|uniref:tripartite tricarboxylate transporter TctB family protein n=1 Tax=Roseinatronobacter sp. NSM TaxID=3457785 RepID=UPI0040353838
MLDRNYRDIVAGFGLTVFGSGAVIYALSNYATGTVTRMGPGMMPAALGAMLAVFGLLIAVPAFLQNGTKVDVRFRALVVLSASILSFALMIEEFGLVPSVFATTLIATFAEAKVPATRALILAGATAFVTWAVFILGLGLSIAAFGWPF